MAATAAAVFWSIFTIIQNRALARWSVPWNVAEQQAESARTATVGFRRGAEAFK
jgi:hypothetical protein